MSGSLDVAAVRNRFPALARRHAGRPVAYLDGPGGTQAAAPVIAAIARHLEEGTSNLGGPFPSSDAAEAATDAARAAIADFVNGSPDEVVFGQNMTSLTFAMSRALARTWSPGDEIVVTRLDHDANITPWTTAAAERGVTVRWVDFDPDAGCTLDLGSLDAALGPRTRLVAVTHASNAVGTVVDVTEVARRAHAVGALVYVDAVHYSPHALPDVGASGVDFLAASAYKFFGPHTGFVWGRAELLEDLEAYKVRPAPPAGPGKWETGTQSFANLAGVAAAVDYLAGLAGPTSGGRRSALAAGYASIGVHERSLAARFLAGIGEMPGVRLYGPPTVEARTPTFAVAVQGRTPSEVQHRLAERGVYVWSGHYYAVAVMERLGLLDAGGLVRIGFVHYSTPEEVDRVLAGLDELATG